MSFISETTSNSEIQRNVLEEQTQTFVMQILPNRTAGLSIFYIGFVLCHIQCDSNFVAYVNVCTLAKYSFSFKCKWHTLLVKVWLGFEALLLSDTIEICSPSWQEIVSSNIWWCYIEPKKQNWTRRLAGRNGLVSLSSVTQNDTSWLWASLSCRCSCLSCM